MRLSFLDWMAGCSDGAARKQAAGWSHLLFFWGIVRVLLCLTGRNTTLVTSFMLMIPLWAAHSEEPKSLSSDPTSQTGGQSAYDETTLRGLPGNRAREKKPSEQAFDKVFKDMPSDPRGRDYGTLLAGISKVCQNYPGSDAAYRCIFAVERWVEGGFVSATDAERIVALKRAFNPAKDRLKELSQQVATATQSRDVAKIHQIVAELREISERHPKTVSEFVALGEIGPLYDSILDHANCLTAVEEFLAKYPYDTVDFPSADTAIPTNLLLRARLVSRTRSLDKGLDAYREAAQSFSRRPQGLAALMEGGELALKNRREDEAIRLFEEIVAGYAPDQDERVVVARFRIAEANLKLGRTDLAVQLLQKIANEMQGTRWEREANDLINFAKNGGAIMPVKDEVASPQRSTSSGISNRWPYTLLVVVNVLIVVMVVSAVLYQRFVKNKH